MRIIMDEQIEYGEKRVLVTSPDDVGAFLRGKEIDQADRELFVVIGLDTRKRVIYADIESVGIDDASLVSPKCMFRTAVKKGAQAIILAHNHPSGDPSPSAEDIKITRTMVESGKLLEISVLDHIVIGHARGDRGITSIRETGLVKFSD